MLRSLKCDKYFILLLQAFKYNEHLQINFIFIKVDKQTWLSVELKVSKLFCFLQKNTFLLQLSRMHVATNMF